MFDLLKLKHYIFSYFVFHVDCFVFDSSPLLLFIFGVCRVCENVAKLSWQKRGCQSMKQNLMFRFEKSNYCNEIDQPIDTPKIEFSIMENGIRSAENGIALCSFRRCSLARPDRVYIFDEWMEMKREKREELANISNFSLNNILVQWNWSSLFACARSCSFFLFLSHCCYRGGSFFIDSICRLRKFALSKSKYMRRQYQYIFLDSIRFISTLHEQ